MPTELRMSNNKTNTKNYEKYTTYPDFKIHNEILKQKIEAKDPKEIYNDIIKSIEKSIQAITQSKAHKTNDKTTLQEREKAVDLLHNYKNNAIKSIKELQSISEWGVFTISVYGETNAGKSTIIETLRILLGESCKLKSNLNFQRIAESINFDAEHIEALQSRLQQCVTQKLIQDKALQVLRQENSKLQADFQYALQRLKDAVQRKKKTLSIGQKFVNLFKKLEEEKKALAQAENLRQMKEQHNAAEGKMQNGINEIDAQIKTYEQELSRINKDFQQLAPYEDGSIIGDGRSDFTLGTQSYQFEVQGQIFSLIDVPGIEGDEKKVCSAINDAVRKSHAVLYVTRKPSAPNKGEAGKVGTVEKIRKQLGSQTEVWAIYNKGVTNPMALQAPKLINEGEAASLQDLEKELASQLGSSYQGCKSLSALPAFYSASKCLLPTNSHYKNKKKFLAGMDAQTLLEKSNFSSFVDFISRDICHNYKEKITKSNLRKVQASINECLQMLDGIINTFLTAKRTLSNQLKSASHELENIEDSIARRIKSRYRDKLSQTKTEQRQAIYSSIEANISNDDFKQMLTHRVESLKDQLVDELQIRLHDEIQGFEKEVKEVVTRFQKNAEELLELNINSYFRIENESFPLEFKIDSGINTLGLISSLGGATALIWGTFFASNPLGWSVAVAIGAVTLLFSFYKSLRGLFSSEYKMEQQRKSADENLNNVFDKIDDMLKNQLTGAEEKISKTMNELKENLSSPLNSVQTTLQALQMASKDIGKISTNIA